MAGSLTQLGQKYMLMGNAGGTDGAFARLATKVKLYASSSTPNKAPGSATWNEVTGSGYTAGGLAITPSSWTLALDGANYKITLADQVWTASGAIANIQGAYITDAADGVMAWFDRSTPITLASGDVYTATGNIIELG